MNNLVFMNDFVFISNFVLSTTLLLSTTLQLLDCWYTLPPILQVLKFSLSFSSLIEKFWIWSLLVQLDFRFMLQINNAGIFNFQFWVSLKKRAGWPTRSSSKTFFVWIFFKGRGVSRIQIFLHRKNCFSSFYQSTS